MAALPPIGKTSLNITPLNPLNEGGKAFPPSSTN